MDALGDATRRAIVERLLEGPLPVGEIARAFPMSRPAISQHLRVLKRADLVVDRPVGNRRYYELNPTGVEALRAYFERFWNGALAAFARAAEARPPGSAAVPPEAPRESPGKQEDL
jgi:DNA-binding transcriptional ArsR family regulator